MVRKFVAGGILAFFIASNASAMLIYSNGFNEDADLLDWFDVSEGGGGASISSGCCSLAPQEGAGYLAFTGNSNDIDTDWYGGLYLGIGSLLNPGRLYELSYYVGGRGRVSDNALLEVGVTTGGFGSGSVLEDVFATNSEAVGEWTKVTTSFVAPNSGSVFLDFAEISSNSRRVGPAVDNLTISSVPLPGTLVLMAVGLFGLGTLVRSRR